MNIYDLLSDDVIKEVPRQQLAFYRDQIKALQKGSQRGAATPTRAVSNVRIPCGKRQRSLQETTICSPHQYNEPSWRHV